MFVDFVKDSKQQYFVILPKSERAYKSVLRLVTGTDEDGRTILDEDGEV